MVQNMLRPAYVLNSFILFDGWRQLIAVPLSPLYVNVLPVLLTSAFCVIDDDDDYATSSGGIVDYRFLQSE